MTSVKGEMYESFAELFAIIKAAGKLERDYVHFLEICQKLIAHFKALSTTLKDTIPITHKMDCPAALNHLITSGVPATVEHSVAAAVPSTASAGIVDECVQNSIKAMDSLKLNMVAVDQVRPLLFNLSGSLNKLSLLLPDFEGKTKMIEWIG